LKRRKFMSEQEGPEARPWSKVKLHKQVVPFEEGNPAQEPLFINYAQVVKAGGSAYIDVGIISLDEILSASDEATFLVLTRLVMSDETLRAIGQQITELLNAEAR
jgi:hypothetical protein